MQIYLHFFTYLYFPVCQKVTINKYGKVVKSVEKIIRCSVVVCGSISACGGHRGSVMDQLCGAFNVDKKKSFFYFTYLPRGQQNKQMYHKAAEHTTACNFPLTCLFFLIYFFYRYFLVYVCTAAAALPPCLLESGH